MGELLLGSFGAIWLGILTSISPCPLATNIAAISFIAKKIESTRFVLLSGFYYTCGRMATYVGLGILIVAGIMSIPGISMVRVLPVSLCGSIKKFNVENRLTKGGASRSLVL